MRILRSRKSNCGPSISNPICSSMGPSKSLGAQALPPGKCLFRASASLLYRRRSLPPVLFGGSLSRSFAPHHDEKLTQTSAKEKLSRCGRERPELFIRRPVTLSVTPVFYIYMERFRESASWFRGKRSTSICQVSASETVAKGSLELDPELAPLSPEVAGGPHIAPASALIA